MKNYLTCLWLLVAVTALPVHGDEVEQKFSIGKVEFVANDRTLTIHVPNQSALTVSVLPGGKFWPPVNHDDQGRFFVGNRIVDTRSGKIDEVPHVHDDGFLLNAAIGVLPEDANQRFRIRNRNNSCVLNLIDLGFGAENKKSATALLKDHNASFAASDKRILILQTHFNAEGNIAFYRVSNINPWNCKILSSVDIGNPDLLVELGWSREGGWWAAGSVEQTLLTSRDGKHWNKVSLPEDTYSLASGYVVSSKEIWLAAGMASHAQDGDPMLLRSLDGGRTWSSLKGADPRLNLLPRYWLEGIRRKYSSVTLSMGGGAIGCRRICPRQRVTSW